MGRFKISDAFATVLRRHRVKRGFSQEKLAEKADLHPTYIGMLERSLRNPSINVAKQLAAALNVSLAKLISEAETLYSRRIRSDIGRRQRSN